MKSINGIWALIVTLILVLIGFNLIQKGMFLDGLTYASIARNMAISQGTFWAPVYCQYFNNPFVDQLPLAFSIQSIFFYTIGDYWFTQNIYSLLALIITLFGINHLWKITNPEHVNLNWTPIILFLLTPITFWSYSNNMLENTVAVFSTFSIFFYLISTKKQSVFYTVLFLLFSIFSFLSKGPVGLFTFSAPFWHYIIYNQRNKSYALVLIKSLGIVFFITIAYLYIKPESISFFKEYWSHQVTKTITGEREVNTSSRFIIIWDLIRELIAPLVLTINILLSKYKERLKINRDSIFFMALCLSGTIPIMISPKQATYYLLPAIIFGLLSFAIMFKPFSKLITEYINLKIDAFNKINYILMLAVFLGLIPFFGKYRKDENLQEFVKELAAYTDSKTIGTTEEIFYNDWSIQAYLMRNEQISLNVDSSYSFILVKKDVSLNSSEYVRIQFPHESNYWLYEKN